MSYPRSGYKLAKFLFGKYEEIPEDWNISRIDELGKLVTGNTPSTSIDEYYGDEFLWASPTDIKNQKYIVNTTSKLSKLGFEISRKIPKDSVLVVCIGSTIGKMAMASKEMSTNQQINTIVCKKCNPEFVYYQLLKNNAIIKNMSNQVAVPILNKKDFGRIKIKIPKKIQEQEKIASIISNIDLLIQQNDQLMNTTKQLKVGLIQQLLIKGIGYTEFKKEKLSKLPQSRYYEIPEIWEVKPLKKLVKINPENITEEYTYEKILYVDIGAIEDFRIKQFEEFKIDERPSRAQRIIKKDDIIVSTVRPYLKAFAKIDSNKENLVCSTGFTVLRPKSNSDIDLIFNYVLSHPFETELIRKMEGMAYPAVTGKIIGECLVPYSTNEIERKKIGEILSNIEKRIQGFQDRIHDLETMKKGLMQKLLTGEIRVKV